MKVAHQLAWLLDPEADLKEGDLVPTVGSRGSPEEGRSGP